MPVCIRFDAFSNFQQFIQSSSSSCNLYSALILRQCSDSTALLQAYAEVIPHSEEETFQIQPPSQPYCYRYLDDAKTAPSMKLCIVYVYGTLVISLCEPDCIVDSTQFLIPCFKSRSSGGMD